MIRNVINLFISFSSQHLFLPGSAQSVLGETMSSLFCQGVGHKLQAGLLEYPRPLDAKYLGTGGKILQLGCFKD